MSVTRISDEGTLRFLAREGCVSTAGVAARFGIQLATARQALSDYLKLGMVAKRLDSTDTGTMNYWSLTDAGKVAAARQQKLSNYRRDRIT